MMHLYLKALHVLWCDGAGGGRHLGIGMKGLVEGKVAPLSNQLPRRYHQFPESTKGREPGPIQTKLHRALGGPPDPTAVGEGGAGHRSVIWPSSLLTSKWSIGQGAVGVCGGIWLVAQLQQKEH